MVSLQYLSLPLMAAMLLLSVKGYAAEEAENKAKSVLDFSVKNIDGEEVDLAQYKGKVIMIVNVASKCGFTKQYAALQEIFEKYKEQGFVILGFPANNFMGQEPGTNAEIKSFCSLTYNVAFDMFEKISVKGKEQAPLYEFLTDKKRNPGFGGSIKWNFTKFLVNREGKVIDRFGSRTKPDSEDMINAIEAALGEKKAEK